MTAWLGNTARALADRKGVTAIEYAIIVAGVMTVIVACYNTYFYRVSTIVGSVTFS